MSQVSQALPKAVRDFITPHSKKMLIGGKWVDAADIDHAVEAARKAFD